MEPKNYVRDYLRKKLGRLYNKEIPFEIEKRIGFFRKLDEEYMYNINKKQYETMKLLNKRQLFSIKIVNENWNGFWLRATGNDENLYMSYLIGARENYVNNKKVDPIASFIEANPKEKYIPFSIEVINEDYKIE